MDYYKELSVSRTATSNEIRTAYKRLALLWHPDRNKAKDAEEKFKKIKQAYDVLIDEQQRRDYDQQQQKNRKSHKNKPTYSTNNMKYSQMNQDLFNLHTFDNFMSNPIDPFDILSDIQFFQESDFTSKMTNSPSYRQFYTQIFNSMNTDLLNSSTPIFLNDDRLFRADSKRSSPVNPIPVIHSTMPNDWYLNQLIDLHEQRNSSSTYSPFEHDSFFDDLTHCRYCHRKISSNRTRLLEHEQRCRRSIHHPSKSSVRV